jgi:hypothetical protein
MSPELYKHNEIAALCSIPRLMRLRHDARDGAYARSELRKWIEILREARKALGN